MQEVVGTMMTEKGGSHLEGLGRVSAAGTCVRQLSSLVTVLPEGSDWNS